MGIFSRDQDIARPRWVDGGGLGWSPDEPLELEKRAKSRHDAPRSVSYRLKRKVVRMFRPTKGFSTGGEKSPVLLRPRQVYGNRDAKPQSDPRGAPAAKPNSASTLPKQARPNFVPGCLPRIVIGFVQGGALGLLLLAHDRGIWPGHQPALATALLLAILIAPLALLEAFDQVPLKLLLLWSGTLGFAIGTLGLWQQWRGGLEVLPVAAIALLAFLAHVSVRAGLHAGRLRPGYGAWTGAAWTVGARLLVWAPIAALSFIVLASLASFVGWLAPHHPGLRNGATLIGMPLMGMASAAGFVIAANGWVQKRARFTLLTSFAFALPILVVAALALPALYLAHAKSLPGILLVVAATLVVAVHAFDWKQVPRRWHMVCQGLFGFVILESILIAGLDLHRRVMAHGWTDMRIYAAVAAFVLALYGLVCLAESFSAMRGGRTLKVMDPAIPALALLVAAICLILSTPLGDPLALAVKSQVARLQHSSDPNSRDSSWLRDQGGRFGQEALAKIENQPAPAQAVPAASTTSAKPLPNPQPPKAPRQVAAPRPAPAPAGPRVVLTLAPEAPLPPAEPQPAGDIVMHTAGAFPVELLAQTWSHTDAAPCLTKASIACDVWFLDLDGDGRNEILFAYGDGARVKANVMRRARGHWIETAAVASPPCPGLLARVRSRGEQMGGLLPGWSSALRTSLRQRAGAPPVELPCPRG